MPNADSYEIFCEQHRHINSDDVLSNTVGFPAALGHDDGIKKLDETLEKILDEIPDARRELHEQIAEAAKQEVDTLIAERINDKNGKIQGWQETHVGSGGGYAAVRPTAALSGENGSPGAITNYLENGHRIRPPSGKAKHYRPNIKVPRVTGRDFYADAQSAVEAKAISIVERFVEKFAAELEGG